MYEKDLMDAKAENVELVEEEVLETRYAGNLLRYFVGDS